ncbi:hypothetical protein Cha6605_1940 [Chamaesiphon minutus PCC 6605]|uniref:Uncharacterized protein n=1 Tax=Chamaesiphon minutus (strain ATCC 27169 / PCC 6605) TaxID=1173020 RepID=K9UD58_CHAP6|nr:hypothetical protein Cha6605_1940 [Chamaesiphon minutus PCC 6605]
MAGLVVGVASVVDGDGDELGDELTAGVVVVVVVVSVVDGDCAVRVEHDTNPPLKKRAAIANPAHIFGGTDTGFAILLRLTNDLTRSLCSVIFFGCFGSILVDGSRSIRLKIERTILDLLTSDA